MPCTKVKFTAEKADDALSRAYFAHKFMIKGAKRNECRKYYCEECKAYHLTSKPDRRIGK